MIARGEVVAVNTASTVCGKPRWIILPEALATFERRRRSAGPAPKPRRQKRSDIVDFYPD
jgi:hypothetical protein